MLLLLLLTPLIASLKWNGVSSDERDELFRVWRLQYNKTYAETEFEYRKKIFLSNAEKILEINNEDNTYKLGVNQFADLTASEFREYIHGGSHGFCLHPSWKQSKNKRLEQLKAELGFVKPKVNEANLPSSVDWTSKGVVTPVKNQGSCGSCWAFSTTGSVESRVAIATGRLVSLSEQELVDCSGSYGNMGCRGGLMDNAFKYVEAKGGLCSEVEYPYQGTDGTCHSCSQRYDSIQGYQDVQKNSEMSLEAAVAQGPVSIAIEADQFSFQFYRGGVLSGSCGTRLDHGVLAVGYGTDSGVKFWKVKNSWGASWGEQGYVRICRGCGKNSGAGECGLLMQPSYPIK